METKWFKTTCQDDGSLIRRSKFQLNRLWKSKTEILAIVDAKAQYTQVSNNVLAQQVCAMKSLLFQRIKAEDTREDLSYNGRQYVPWPALVIYK